MKQTVEAVIDEQGHVRLTEPVAVKGVHRALLTILDEQPPHVDETLMLAEKSLAEDWLRPEEDEAWSHLQ
ncbi:MAG: hypothetical protein R3E35_00835 [Rhodocyclaceae bacterium]